MKSSTTSSMRTFRTPEDEELPTSHIPKKNKKRRRYIKLIPWLLILILIIVSVFLWYEYSQAKQKLNTTSVSYNQQLTLQLSRLIQIPNTKPVILTLKNANNVKKIAFYSSAKNGDIVFEWTKDNEYILYRPSTNKIINIIHPY